MTARRVARRANLILGAVALALAGAACARGQEGDASLRDTVADGRDVAVRQCSACHGLDDAQTSPRPDAPPFRTLGQRYRLPVLEEELIEGIKLGHPDMPQFQFEPRGVDALIAYLRSIQEADDQAPAGPLKRN